jgi:NAD-dependent dihydropyrimidine dehydrogenase PreA subunit
MSCSKRYLPPLLQCPTQAVIYNEDSEALFGGHIIIDADKCDDCKICIDLCCGNAIS